MLEIAGTVFVNSNSMKLWMSILLLALVACESKTSIEKEEEDEPKPPSKVEKYYTENVNDSIESIAKGSVGNGSLAHATLIPFEGSNYVYFDKSSYLGGRAFTHNKVAEITLATYAALEKQGVQRTFRVMEFSRKEGGKIFPHRTHQNGLSVDFMMPKMKDGKPYYELDKKGASHYMLEFDKDGAWSEDSSVKIDFDMAAKHILELDKQARKSGMRIDKVIFNTNLRDNLYATPNGKKLRKSGIYLTRNLSRLINELHDDHYHVDFIAL